jgi:LacI family transcriptional regulator
MKKNATIYDISKLAKVSIATVSRVVNNDDSVREKTREKVLEAMNKLRYRPSTSAKAMAEGRNTTSVGVLYRFSSSGFFSELLKGIDIGLSESNCLMISSRLKEQPTSVEEIKNYIKLSGVQALLFLYPDMSPDFIDFVKMSSIPIVLIGEPCDEAGVHQVLTDNKFGIRELVQYISESNKRPNVILHGPLDNREALDRLEESKKYPSGKKA